MAESKIKAHKIQEELKTFEEERKKYSESIELNDLISQQKSKLRRLMLEVSKYEDVLDMQEVGIYKPYFNFDTSEKYKDKIISIKEEQKDMIRDGSACVCDTPWTVNGSRTQGAAMVKENIRLALRAFNNECDSIIAKVDYKNIERSEERMQKAFEYINKLNTRNDIRILPAYLSLKRQELRATYEYAVKKEEERQEQLRIKEQMREELKAQKELEKAKLDAEKAQKEYEKEIERAKKLLEKDKQNERLREQLAKLEKELQEAIEKGQRAISQAQLTKSGHVYVISNIGSFGDNVYKIGMTRRLEPMDRIRELGDASVPFSFDVHAMIYSDNAPELEYTLHKIFADKQINRVNPRKEFFKVSLEEISNEVKKYNADIEFTMIAEAKEYRESIALAKEHKSAEPEMDVDDSIDDYIDKI